MDKHSVFPTKQEIINTLLKEDPKIKTFHKIILLVEHKKVNSVLGIVKGELIRNGRCVMKGSMTCIPDAEEEYFNWNVLSEGQSYFQAFSIDHPKDSLFSAIKKGITKSIEDGRLPFK